MVKFENVSVNVSGNLIINQAYAGTVSEYNPDLIIERSQELLSSGRPSDTIDANIKITLSPFKLFFKMNENGSRQPDLTTRFPIIINYEKQQVNNSNK